MIAVAQRGNTVLLADSEEPDAMGVMVDKRTGEESAPILVASVLATGYWRDVDEGIVAAFDPTKHPRKPAGGPDGGQWAPSQVGEISQAEDLVRRTSERQDLLMQGLAQGNAVLIDEIDNPNEWSDWYDAQTNDVVRARGRAFDAGFEPIEADEQWTEMGNCFENATQIAWGDHPDWTYTEGYAYPAAGDPWMVMVGEPVHHAWLVTDEGKVYDPTWGNTGSAYVGVPVETTFLYEELARRKIYGLFATGDVRMPGPDDVVDLGRPIG
jgi:hypothetical protein